MFLSLSLLGVCVPTTLCTLTSILFSFFSPFPYSDVQRGRYYDGHPTTIRCSSVDLDALLHALVISLTHSCFCLRSKFFVNCLSRSPSLFLSLSLYRCALALTSGGLNSPQRIVRYVNTHPCACGAVFPILGNSSSTSNSCSSSSRLCAYAVALRSRGEEDRTRR
jgi:hypothetical protein